MQKSPSKSLVLPYYICGAIFFVVLCVLLFFSSDAFSGHYFHPKLLAITHIAALGWGSMVIFGALYQLLPVILGVPLYSELVGKCTFYTFATGVICISWSFWNFYVGIHIQIASVLLLLSFFLFFVNIVSTTRKATKWTIEADFIVTASLWLLVTGVLGTIMAFNFTHPFLHKSHLLFLKIHAHMGMVGWFILLIMGVGSKLIPMFLLSHNLHIRKLNYAYYFVNFGLVCFSVDVFFRDEKAFFPLYTILIVTGILFFLSFIYEAYRKRVRKQLDIGLKHSFIAFVFLFLPVFIGIMISFSSSSKDKFLLHIYLVYGVSIFLGFISSLILGQTFKTLPFIVWLHRYSKLAGKRDAPLPKNLYSEKIANWQYIAYLMALPTIVIGILMTSSIVIESGAILLLITALLYNINVFKIVLHALKK